MDNTLNPPRCSVATAFRLLVGAELALFRMHVKDIQHLSSLLLKLGERLDLVLLGDIHNTPVQLAQPDSARMWFYP